MYRRLHTACAESSIVISRSVTQPVLLHKILPSCHFCQMTRSRHQVDLKTATQVSTVVPGTSPCKTCELLCAGRLSTKIDNTSFPPFSQDQSARETHRPRPQRAHPKFLYEFQTSLIPKSRLTTPYTRQMTKCDHRTTKKRHSSDCLKRSRSARQPRSHRAGASPR